MGTSELAPALCRWDPADVLQPWLRPMMDSFCLRTANRTTLLVIFVFFFLVAHFTFCHQLHIIAFTIFYSIIIACKTWKACSQQWYCFHIFHNIVSMFTTRNIFVETGKALKASWIKHSTLSLTGEGHGGKQLVSRETRMPIPNVWVIQ